MASGVESAKEESKAHLKASSSAEIGDHQAERVHLNQFIGNGIREEKDEVRGIECALGFRMIDPRVCDLIEINRGLVTEPLAGLELRPSQPRCRSAVRSSSSAGGLKF